MTRTMKKFTGFVLMVCMIVSLFAGVTTAFAAKDFKDVPENNWAKPYVDFVVDKGYFAGATADLFKPDDNMTRAMFVAVMAKVEGLTLDNNIAVDFTDVQSGKYYAGAVKWATDNGIVSGYGNGKFGPDDAITREQICVMMDKYIQYHDANNDTKYLDRKASVEFKDASDISSWAADSVQKCVSYGLVQGFPDGKFYPKRNATRAEVAVMIYRLALWKEVVDGDEYTVSYKYESGTEGVELPSALNILIIPDKRTFHTGDVAEAYDPALSTFYADGKLWKFEGYKEKTITVAESNVEFVGVWVAEDSSEAHVKYTYVDIDGKTVVPVEAPTDDKTYKKGDKVTATAPESPVKTENGTWTFVGWDKDGAQTKTETVEDHDVVFTGYWKYNATKFHVTYVAKVYGTGEDLPKEVAKELEGRCPVDNNAYDDGAWVWIKEPTSKADYSDSTGRVWNYRGATYKYATTIKGADIEVVEYWGYAGIPFVLTYANSYEDLNKEPLKLEMSAADIRNLTQALPRPTIETHYSGETVTIKWPTQTVAKARNSLIVFPIYDVDGEWVFQYYKNDVTGDTYTRDNDESFRMPADSVQLTAYWKYYPYVNEFTYVNDVNVKENEKLLPKPATQVTKERYVPGDTVPIQLPKSKTVKDGDKTYTFIGASIKNSIDDPESEELINESSFTLNENNLNDDNSVTIYWNWIEKQPEKYSVKYEFYTKSGTLPADIQKLKPEDELKQYSDGTVVTAEDPSSFTYEVDGTTWIWHKWDVNGKKQDYTKINGKDVTFRGEWSATKTLTATFRFVSVSSEALDKEVVAILGDDVPYAKINLQADKEFGLPDVPAEVKVDGGKWVFKGWESKVATVDNEKNTAKTKRNAEIIGNWEFVPNK